MVNSGGNELPEDQYLFLKTLFVYNNGKDWLWTTSSLHHWNFTVQNFSEPITNNWEGLKFGFGSSIVNIELPSFNITGHLPTELGYLTGLTSLILSNNFVTSFPEEIGYLTNLNVLRCDDNSLTGNVANIISNLGSVDKLQILELGTNSLTGEIPSLIAQLKDLQFFNLQNNDIHGAIPTEIGLLNNLTFISLAFSNFQSSKIPTEMGKLTNLNHLDLDTIQVRGPIPSEIGLLTKLTFLELYGNDLSGPIPTELANLQSYYLIRMENNININGTFGTPFCSLVRPNKTTILSVSGISCYDRCFENYIIPDALPGVTPNVLNKTNFYIGTSVDNYCVPTIMPTLPPIQSDSKSAQVGPIIGGVVGGVVGLIALLFIFLLYQRKFKSQFQNIVKLDQESLVQIPNSNSIEFQQSNSRNPVWVDDLSIDESNSTTQQFSWEDISLAGSTVNDSIIGHGAFGMVLKASISVTQSIPNRKQNKIIHQVAVKVLLRSELQSAEHYEEIKALAWKEANIMKLIEIKSLHTCIAKCYGIVEGKLPPSFLRDGDEEAVGIVMKHIAGGSLDSLLFPESSDSSKVPLSLYDKLQLLLKICHGILELHLIGIVHADIKPRNILLSRHNPPDIHFIDFGLSIKQGEDILSKANASTLQSTVHTRGTPLYCAPEMLVNPFDRMFSEKVARASKKTDMYAFAITAWEVLARERAFLGITSEATLCSKVHQGYRPPMSLLPIDTPKSVKDVIESCWDVDRSKRKQAVECYVILNTICNVYTEGKYDIFFSHAWAMKPFLSHVYNQLIRKGYRVWYDQTDMEYNMQESMKSGIENSTIMIACLSRIYQTRPHCMYELRVAREMVPKKPIIFLSTDPNIESWANEELLELCGIKSDDLSAKILDMSSSAEEQADINSSDDSDEDWLQKLRINLIPLFSRLEEEGCKPSLRV